MDSLRIPLLLCALLVTRYCDAAEAASTGEFRKILLTHYWTLTKPGVKKPGFLQFRPDGKLQGVHPASGKTIEGTWSIDGLRRVRVKLPKNDWDVKFDDTVTKFQAAAGQDSGFVWGKRARKIADSVDKLR